MSKKYPTVNIAEDYESEPTFSVSLGKAPIPTHKYNPMTETKKRAIEAFNSLVIGYKPKKIVIDTKPPFHVVERSKLRHYLDKFKSSIFNLFKKETKIDPSIVDNRSHTILKEPEDYNLGSPMRKILRKRK